MYAARVNKKERSALHSLRRGRLGDLVVEVSRGDGESTIVATATFIDGVLTTAVEAQVARDHGFPAASGTCAFELLMAEAQGTGTVVAVEAIWNPSSDNYKSFWASRSRGVTDQVAASETWTGQQAYRHGFTRVTGIDLGGGDRVTLRFVR